MCGFCAIIPHDVLIRLSNDTSYSKEVRENLVNTADIDTAIRQLRDASRKLTQTTSKNLLTAEMSAVALNVTVYDCKNSQNIPGVPVPNPATAADQTAKRTFQITTKVADFYKKIFGRNSIDGNGMTMMSSIHFGDKYNNAFWNGTQMTYGDGDGKIFVDFTKGDDVVCHELTHGVTQHSLQLSYTNEAGGLNESMSDVFGSMFRQWRANQTVTTADWLIGHDIMGPLATAKGLTCLRDMAVPGAAHCLAPQPDHYSQYQPGMDPHQSSGIPNRAFCLAAKAVGGNSWDKVGKIWYQALTGFKPSPNMKMGTFARRTRKAANQMFPGGAVVAAVDNAWKVVGVP